MCARPTNQYLYHGLQPQILPIVNVEKHMLAFTIYMSRYIQRGAHKTQLKISSGWLDEPPRKFPNTIMRICSIDVLVSSRRQPNKSINENFHIGKNQNSKLNKYLSFAFWSIFSANFFFSWWISLLTSSVNHISHIFREHQNVTGARISQSLRANLHDWHRVTKQSTRWRRKWNI